MTVEAEAEHVDDRCESDISGVATDDSDLSSVSSGADIAMEMGSVVYRHQPNPFFNTMLTCCTVLVLCFAVGIGVGHYFGQSVATTAFTFLGLYPHPTSGWTVAAHFVSKDGDTFCLSVFMRYSRLCTRIFQGGWNKLDLVVILGT